MIFFKRFLQNIKIKFIIFFHNIKHPQRYLLKVKYFQRPFIFLQLRRKIYTILNNLPFSTNQQISINQLFEKGITSYYDKGLSQILTEISNKYSSIEFFQNSKELSGGYLSLILPKEYQELILPKVLPIVKYYFGSNKLAKLRFDPLITYISRETYDKTNLKTRADFWHIDTPNQLTMHMSLKDVDENTPHLGFSGSIQNVNLIDYFYFSNKKDSFSNFKKKLKHKNLYNFGKAGTVSIFDSNSMHKHIYPEKSKKPSIYIHFNFTPGNY